jgi:predicted RecB family nuclease
MASIDAVEGISHKQATSLRKARIRTVESLLKKGSTRKGRRDIASATEIDEKLILEWVNRADLMRVRGVGEEYSDLLEATGVDTVKELRRRNPTNLLAAMVEVNDTQRSVRRLPTEAMVQHWVDHAKELEAIISY